MNRYALALLVLMAIMGGCLGGLYYSYSKYAAVAATGASVKAERASAAESKAKVSVTKEGLLVEVVPYDKFLNEWEPVFARSQVVSDVQQRIERIADENGCKILKPGVGSVESFRNKGKGARHTVPSGMELEIKLAGEAWRLHNALLDLECTFPQAQVEGMSFTGPSTIAAGKECTLVWTGILPVYPVAPKLDGPVTDSQNRKENKK